MANTARARRPAGRGPAPPRPPARPLEMPRTRAVALAVGPRRARARPPGGAAAAAGRLWSRRRPARGPCSWPNADAPGSSRTRPRAASSSRAATASSSLRPAVARGVSASKERPSTAAAASTWRPTSPSASTRARERLGARGQRPGRVGPPSGAQGGQVLDHQERQALGLGEEPPARRPGPGPRAARRPPPRSSPPRRRQAHEGGTSPGRAPREHLGPVWARPASGRRSRASLRQPPGSSTSRGAPRAGGPGSRARPGRPRRPTAGRRRAGPRQRLGAAAAQDAADPLAERPRRPGRLGAGRRPLRARPRPARAAAARPRPARAAERRQPTVRSARQPAQPLDERPVGDPASSS